MKIRRPVVVIVLSLITFCFSGSVRAQKSGDYPFFVFNNGVQDEQYDTPEKQALMLKSFGYDGMEMRGIADLPETLRALDKHGLKLYTLYININLDDKVHPYDEGLKEAFRLLKGRQAMPWFYITSEQYKPSSRENDVVAVPILQEIADLANEYGIRVMIYPHVNFWVDNVEDALRVAEKVNRPNLGITFNLCHFLADKGIQSESAFIPLVEKAMPHVFAISLNGADQPSEDILKSPNPWKYFIQPLGRGTYDTYKYFQAFVERGFRGPVGLQCYNIVEEKAMHLKESMITWKNFQRKMAR